MEYCEKWRKYGKGQKIETLKVRRRHIELLAAANLASHRVAETMNGSPSQIQKSHQKDIDL